MRVSIPFLVATLSALLPVTNAIPTNSPIYLADIFHAPTMHVLAYLPGQQPCESSIIVEENQTFSIGGVDGIELKSYWKDASLLKDGQVFADCKMGPQAVALGSCPDGHGHEFTGIIKRTWTCWVI